MGRSAGQRARADGTIRLARGAGDSRRRGAGVYGLPVVATRGLGRRDQDRPGGARRQSRGRGGSRTARAAGAFGAAVLRLFHVAVGGPGRIADILPVGGGGGLWRI